MLAQARARWAQARAEGREQELLRGKNFACLGRSGAESDVAALGQAAVAMGARLAWLSAMGRTGADAGQVAALALLGQLYDAVVCAESSPEACAELERQIGVPVISAAWAAGSGSSGDDWPALLLAAVPR